MEKFLKRLLGIAAVTATVAGVIYFLRNRQAVDDDFFEDEFEDEDFDLDEDLKPAKEREYVSISPKTEEEKPEVETVEKSDETVETEEAKAAEEI